MTPGVELILDAPASARGKRFFAALKAAAPDWVHASSVYTGRRNVICLYGGGNPVRMEYIAAHRARGGRVVAWDLAYWDRIDSLRVAVDGLHPTAQQLAVAGDAPGRRAFHLRNDADAAGHVLLVGLGRKSVAATGAAPLRWERRALAVARERWPGARIVWRPKGEPIALDGLPMSVGVPIERALLGARAVVCAHSNVAVDACVAGVPVYCEGGAAASLYAETPSPDARARSTFLRQLSWFEWHRRDASAAWAWVLKLLLATGGGLPCG